MITINGVYHQTVVDAARELGVSVRSVDGYIERGILPTPPTVDYGLRAVKVFSDEYLRDAKAALKRYRDSRRGSDV